LEISFISSFLYIIYEFRLISCYIYVIYKFKLISRCIYLFGPYFILCCLYFVSSDPLSSYGRSDLDPLYSGGPGGHGGGMIFDPMRNQPGGYGQPNFGGEFGGEFGGHSMIPR